MLEKIALLPFSGYKVGSNFKRINEMKMNRKLMAYVKGKFLDIASDLMQNPQGLKFKLDKAKEKISTQSVKESLGKNVEDLKTLIRMARAWASRSYRNVSSQTILYTVAAIIYFVTPTDFMPDFIIGLGFLDDIAVIRWVIGQITSDLERFKAWEAEQGEEQE